MSDASVRVIGAAGNVPERNSDMCLGAARTGSQTYGETFQGFLLSGLRYEITIGLAETASGSVFPFLRMSVDTERGKLGSTYTIIGDSAGAILTKGHDNAVSSSGTWKLDRKGQYGAAHSISEQELILATLDRIVPRIERQFTDEDASINKAPKSSAELLQAFLEEQFGIQVPEFGFAPLPETSRSDL